MCIRDSAVEKPSYLAALQTFHLYDPKIVSVSLNDDGIDCDELEKILKENDPKFIYVIPNFQNPTGLTYTQMCIRDRNRNGGQVPPGPGDV